MKIAPSTSNLASLRVLPPFATARSSSSSRWAWSASHIALSSAPRSAKVSARSAGPALRRARSSSAAARSTPPRARARQRLLGGGVHERVERARALDPAAADVAAQGEHRTAHCADPELAQDERVVERDLAQAVVAARGAAVAGGHVRLQQQRVRVGLERAQLRHVLGRLPVHHLAVVEATSSPASPGRPSRARFV